MGGACSTHGRDEKCIKILNGKPEGGDHAKYLGVNVKIILEWCSGK
jgi:hypothetical protein